MLAAGVTVKSISLVSILTTEFAQKHTLGCSGTSTGSLPLVIAIMICIAAKVCPGSSAVPRSNHDWATASARTMNAFTNNNGFSQSMQRGKLVPKKRADCETVGVAGGEE
jgi:hypothetical protein